MAERHSNPGMSDSMSYSGYLSIRPANHRTLLRQKFVFLKWFYVQMPFQKKNTELRISDSHGLGVLQCIFKFHLKNKKEDLRGEILF